MINSLKSKTALSCECFYIVYFITGFLILVYSAKLDGTENDIPPSAGFRVAGFPTLKFKAAGSSEFIDYDGDRTLESLIEFVEEKAKMADCGLLFFAGLEVAGFGDFGMTSLNVVNLADCGGGEEAPFS